MTPSDPVTALVEQHLKWARGIARQAKRSLPSSIDLDDLADVAQIALWRAAQTYRDDYQLIGYAEPVPFRAYARQRVYFACLMAFRRRNYREATHEQIPEVIADPKRDLEREARRREVRRLCEDVGRFLTPRHQRLLNLVHLQGRSLQEAARILNVSETWASIEHGRTLRALRERLEKRGITGTGDCL